MPLPEEPWIGETERLAVFVWLVPRILSIVALVVGIVFVVALLVTLGLAEGRMPIQEGLRTAAGFAVEYLGGLVHGDLGLATPRHAAATPTPVIEELGRTLPKSLGLLLMALVLATVVGLPLGILAATRRGSHLSGLLIVLSTLGISTPSYFAAMLLITLAVRFYTTTGLRILPVHGFGWDTHLILPALVLSARPLANMVRLTYNSLTDILAADYVRTAHGKGLGPWTVLFRHVLRNGAVPLLTTVGVSLSLSLSLSVSVWRCCPSSSTSSPGPASGRACCRRCRPVIPSSSWVSLWPWRSSSFWLTSSWRSHTGLWTPASAQERR